MSKTNKYHSLLTVIVLFVFNIGTASAQTTEFTYQGRLTDAGMAANGNYDFQFALFSATGGGTQIGSPLTRTSVAVSSGVFTVQLDFGAGAFPGADRFLEIGVRLAGGGSFTTLVPRQQITAASYGIRSVSAATADTATNATQLGGVPANQYVVTSDARLSDPRSPTPGSANYIQNTTAQQAASNFNISGTGTANIINATRYNINGSRVLSVGAVGTLFAGIDAGTSGLFNSFVGARAGAINGAGGYNSFFGESAGHDNTSGFSNSFFGRGAGQGNFTGFQNSFFGRDAGQSNQSGDNNTLIGYLADVGSNNLSFATAIGAGSVVSLSNSIVLGRANGSDVVRIPSSVIIDGSLVVGTLGTANTSAQLCRNTADRISPCSSSLRYKTDVNTFSRGLDVIRRLRPITFSWKDGGMHDVGFAAEEVEQIEPLLTTYNAKGEIEGVKYGQITTVLVNAVQQQQQIIEQQQRQIDALKKLVCLDHPDADVCR